MDDVNSLIDLALNQRYVGPQTRIRPSEEIFNPKDKKIHEDIIRMICQYLNDEGYNLSQVTLLDEAAVKWQESAERAADAIRIKKAIIGGLFSCLLLINYRR